MSRRRSLPWNYRYSRLIMGAIAMVGIVITAYLTISALMGKTPICTQQEFFGLAGCERVLNSKYAKIGEIPLSLFGLLAYIAMAVFALSPYLVNPDNNKQLRSQLEDWTWKFLLIGGTSMVIFSGYLIYISLFILGAECIYCLTSAACSIGLLIFAIIGREWEEMGQVFFTTTIVAMVTLVSSLGLFNLVDSNSVESVNGKIVIGEATGNPQPPKGWAITTESGEAEIALAKHLTSIGAKKYGAFWCPHCYEQKQLFGAEAFALVNYVECDPSGENPQRELCVKVGIQGFPTWEIKGKLYPGTQSLEQLAQLSGYTGPTNFKYTLPGR
jgi:uncharacterized membrane protein